ncbi:adenylosuccinate lyase [Candidatus Bathyarchaeota archaeon]|nr:adenylosuccinate lyase [Candidatus Bathyarchaeota archaeon]
MAILPIDTGRYGSVEMRRIFDEESRLQKILDVEAAVAYAHSQVGNIAKDAAEEVIRKANTRHVKVERCKEIDKEIDHDLMAVVRALSEVCSPSAARWVHFGLTSADVEDTAYALQFKEALGLVESGLIDLERILYGLVEKYRETMMAGRTHGQHMAVITLGLKLAVWMREISRQIQRLRQTRERVLVGKIMGAVGTGAGLGEHAIEIQRIALERLGLKPADMVTQVIQRDIHAELLSTLSLIGCSLEKFALEVRNLQRTEIMEIMEPFKFERQVGSSAMPSKRNPVKSERVCSLARLMRGLLIPAYENIALWHERDLTNSANERFTFAMAFILLDEMILDMKSILSGLLVFPENMEKNLEITGGLLVSENIVRVMVERGVARQEAHEIVRRCSMRAVRERKHFSEVLCQDPDVSSVIKPGEVNELLDYSRYLGVAQKLIDNALALSRAELETYQLSIQDKESRGR